METNMVEQQQTQPKQNNMQDKQPQGQIQPAPQRPTQGNQPPSAPLVRESKVIGVATPRIEGPLKTTGSAKYSSDFHFPDLLQAWPVCATIASGTIESIDTASVSRMPGVVAVYTHENIGPLYRIAPGAGTLNEKRPPLEDNTVYYYGQYVAVVVAQTLEQARAAAEATKVTYTKTPHDISEKLIGTKLSTPEKRTVSKRGDTAAAFAASPVTHDAVYKLAGETHNPIELHASLAVYKDGKFTLYETTQGVMNHRNVMASMLGVPKENVQVITRFLGSGFGGKGWPWPQAFLAAACARNLGRPVKLVVSRSMMFQSVGHRPVVEQRIQLAASADGKLTVVGQDWVNHTSMTDDYNENCGEATPFMYSCPNVLVTGAQARRNVGTPGPMRGPGAVPGIYGIESAMDELAIKIKMDPVALRLLNEPSIDEESKKPFSSRHLKECLTVGAEKFGWDKRNPDVGSMKNADGTIMGWGMAAASWIAVRFETEASVQLRRDGTARVVCGTQDIGTGTYTVIAQLVSHETSIALDKIEVVIGDSSLPPGPLSGGSAVTASVVPAVLQAAQNAVRALLSVATTYPDSQFQGKQAADLEMNDGAVRLKDQPGTSLPVGQVVQKARLESVNGDGRSGPSFGPGFQDASFHSFGAQFVEVTWRPEIAQLRVSRVVSVMDVGKIMNPTTARNQVEGAIVMGVGMALLEGNEYDQRSGAPINSNLADYIVPVNADCPKIDVTFVEYPDYKLNPAGARGVGEIGLAGVAPAIASAIHHATGTRVRHLPIRIEDLLA
jgi:xanthine dehydrogenase YagR molybdenum-binding subunit